MIYLLPRITTAVPSPLVAIVVLTALSIWLDAPVNTVGDMGELPEGLPYFVIARRAADAGNAADHPALFADDGRRRPARIAADRADRRRHDAYRQQQAARKRGPGHCQHRRGVLRRHGRLRHDRPVGHQRDQRRTRAPVQLHRRPVAADPARAARPDCRPGADAGAGRGDDHGQHRDVQLELDPQPDASILPRRRSSCWRP